MLLTEELTLLRNGFSSFCEESYDFTVLISLCIRNTGGFFMRYADSGFEAHS